MGWHWSPYLLPLAITAVICVVLAFIGWRNRRTRGAISVTLLMLLIGWWSITYFFEIASTSLNVKLFWIRLEYIGISLVPLFFFKFVLEFRGAKKHPLIKSPGIYLLFIVPAITQLGLWMNTQWQLFYTSTTLNSTSGYVMLETTYGPLFWLNTAQAYTFLLIATFLLGHDLVTAASGRLYRRQIAIILLGVGAPWLANLLTITNLSPFDPLDLTPFAFTITGIAIAWGLFRFNLLDLNPIARNMLVKRLPEGVLVVDARNRIIDINPALTSLLPYEMMELMGKTPSQIFPDNPQLVAQFETSEPAQFEVQLNGRPYAVHLTPLRADNETLEGKLAVFHNISKQKEAEDYLRKAKESAEIARQQAEEAHQTAAATARAKTNFLTTMSHEIRTPVNAIVGTGQLLQDTPLTGEQKELVTTIHSSSDSLLKIINNILDFSLLEAGSLELKTETFDLRKLVHSVTEPLTPVAQQKQLQLQTEIQPDLAEYYRGDPVRIRQILSNLLQNSIKFSEKGVVSIRVTGKPVPEEMHVLSFSVTDEGIGIPAGKLEQLFQSFHQIDNSLTRLHGGMGLGLAISQKLCQLMDGRIQVESIAGEGSCFTFSITLPDTKEIPVTLSSPVSPSLNGKRLLIISKDLSNRRKLSQDARAAGMKTYVASGLTDALYWVQTSDPFDSFLIDAALLAENEHMLLQLNQVAPHAPVLLLQPAAVPPAPNSNDLISQIIPLPLSTSNFYDALHAVFSRGRSQNNAAGEGLMAKRIPLRILLVEDNRINQKVAEKLLNKLGYSIDIAPNGAIALERLSQESYDVILMDIQMPIMDGLQATQTIRQQYPPEQQPHIIAVTAHALEGDREYYLSVGMDDYLSKPVQSKELVEALYRVRPKPLHLPEPAPTTPPREEEPEAPPIDLEELEKLIGEPADQILQEMAPLFISNADALINTLRTAVSQGNQENIRTAAHRLKGTCASMSMPVLSALSNELEMLASNNDIAAASQKLAEVETAYQHVKTCLPVP